MKALCSLFFNFFHIFSIMFDFQQLFFQIFENIDVEFFKFNFNNFVVIELHSFNFETQKTFHDVVIVKQFNQLTSTQINSIMKIDVLNLITFYIDNVTKTKNTKSKNEKFEFCFVVKNYYEITFEVSSTIDFDVWAFEKLSKSNNSQLNVFLCDHKFEIKMHRLHFFLKLHSKFETWMIKTTNHCFDLQSDFNKKQSFIISRLCSH